MRSKIMVLFDSATIRSESLQYSVALAKRMNSSLILLVILPFEPCRSCPDEIEPMIERGLQVRESLKQRAASMCNEDIEIETAIRIGNPRSELVKYLAEAGRFKIIIWGAKPELMKKKDHWLVQMKDVLECPVVTPFIKNDGNRTAADEQRP